MAQFGTVPRLCMKTSATARVQILMHLCSLQGPGSSKYTVKLHDLLLARIQTPPASGAHVSVPLNLCQRSATPELSENGLDILYGWVDNILH